MPRTAKRTAEYVGYTEVDRGVRARRGSPDGGTCGAFSYGALAGQGDEPLGQLRDFPISIWKLWRDSTILVSYLLNHNQKGKNFDIEIEKLA